MFPKKLIDRKNDADANQHIDEIQEVRPSRVGDTRIPNELSAVRDPSGTRSRVKTAMNPGHVYAVLSLHPAALYLLHLLRPLTEVLEMTFSVSSVRNAADFVSGACGPEGSIYADLRSNNSRVANYASSSCFCCPA